MKNFLLKRGFLIASVIFYIPTVNMLVQKKLFGFAAPQESGLDFVDFIWPLVGNICAYFQMYLLREDPKKYVPGMLWLYATSIYFMLMIMFKIYATLNIIAE